MSKNLEDASECKPEYLEKRPGRSPVMVMTGSFWTGSTEHGLARGFRNLGWVVKEVESNRYFGKSESLAERFFSRMAFRSQQSEYEDAIISACKHLRPSVLLIIKGSFISRRTLIAVRELKTKIVCFWPDLDFRFRSVELKPSDFDFFVTTKSFQIGWVENQGLHGNVEHIAHGYEPDAHRPILDMKSDIAFTADIRYIGNHSPTKQSWIMELYQAMPDIDLRLVGNRWTQALPRELSARLVEATQYIGADYALAVQTAKINIAVHSGTGENGWEELVSTRTFEIPACAGFMLHIDNHEVREYFEVGAEIDVFSSTEELVDKCGFYLKNDQIRRKMAQKAYDRCVNSYSYHMRAREIERAIKARNLVTVL